MLHNLVVTMQLGSVFLTIDDSPEKIPLSGVTPCKNDVGCKRTIGVEAEGLVMLILVSEPSRRKSVSRFSPRFDDFRLLVRLIDFIDIILSISSASISAFCASNFRFSVCSDFLRCSASSFLSRSSSSSSSAWLPVFSV